MGGRCVPFDVNSVCDCCGMMGAYDFMGDLLCEKCATGNDQEGGMKCHDGEECKLGCTEDRMQCAVPVSIVDELRTGVPIYEKRAEVIADYVEKLEADLAAAQRELAAWKRATSDFGETGPHISPSWWIPNRAAELLTQEGGK